MSVRGCSRRTTRARHDRERCGETDYNKVQLSKGGTTRKDEGEAGEENCKRSRRGRVGDEREGEGDGRRRRTLSSALRVTL